VPSGESPSIVVILAPESMDAGSWHDRAGAPLKCTAGGYPASVFRALEIQRITEDPEERHIARDINGPRASVDAERYSRHSSAPRRWFPLRLLSGRASTRVKRLVAATSGSCNRGSLIFPGRSATPPVDALVDDATLAIDCLEEHAVIRNLDQEK
jgi:hypothetical protein